MADEGYGERERAGDAEAGVLIPEPATEAVE
jgi:hypothetical protein